MTTPPIPLGYQQLTNLAQAKELVIPTGANFALIRCTGADVRWRDDGTPPTSLTGYPLAVGDELHYDAVIGLPSLRFVEQAAGAEISIAYYGV